MTFSIAIAGAGGRMGRALIAAAAADDRFRVSGGTARPDSAAVGIDLGVLAGGSALGASASDDVRAASAGADVWIDFTAPDASVAALKDVGARAAIIGTTGFSVEQEQEIATAAQHMAIVRSGNFSLGVNLLAALVEQTARKLGPEWDIEILESHHRRKVDAPSGTALMLGQAAAYGRSSSANETRLAPHHGITGPRRPGGIGFASIRAGGIVGEHDVVFASEREVVKLSHQALDRAVFADGALAAAAWAAQKPPGQYTMRDVLGF